MGSDEDDTTYSYVEPSERKRNAAKTMVAGGDAIPPTVDEPDSSSISSELEPSSDLSASRHALGIDDIEALLEQGEYRKVCDLLGPADRAEELSPTLALLYIVARGEVDHGAALADLPHLAMETSGKILGMPARSRASRLVAKRLLGLSASDVRGRMPSAPVRIGLIALAVVIGVVIGWLAGPGGVNLGEVFDSMTR